MAPKGHAGTLTAAYAGRALHILRATAPRSRLEQATVTRRPRRPSGAKAYEVARALLGALAAASAGRGIDFGRPVAALRRMARRRTPRCSRRSRGSPTSSRVCPRQRHPSRGTTRRRRSCTARGAPHSCRCSAARLWCAGGNGVDAEDTRYGGHALGTRHGAVYALQRTLGHTGGGEVAAAFIPQPPQLAPGNRPAMASTRGLRRR